MGVDDTSCGLPVILEAFLAEFFGLVGGLIVFFMEKTNLYVKAHSCNAIIWGIIYIVLWVLLAIFAAIATVGVVAGVICGIICAIFGLIFCVVWIWNWVMALIKAGDEEFKAVPIVSGWAMKWAEK